VRVPVPVDFEWEPEDAMIRNRFTAEEVRRLTGLSRRQLERWEHNGFIVPAEIRGEGHGSRRSYDFTNLMEYRTAKRLLDIGLSTQAVRKAVQALRQIGKEQPLSGMALVSDGRRLYARFGDDWIDALRGGQLVFGVMVGDMAEDLRRDIANLPKDAATKDKHAA
jgi:DNA-binding transcriptional MerR regulator